MTGDTGLKRRGKGCYENSELELDREGCVARPLGLCQWRQPALGHPREGSSLSSHPPPSLGSHVDTHHWPNTIGNQRATGPDDVPERTVSQAKKQGASTIARVKSSRPQCMVHTKSHQPLSHFRVKSIGSSSHLSPLITRFQSVTTVSFSAAHSTPH